MSLHENDCLISPRNTQTPQALWMPGIVLLKKAGLPVFRI